MDIEYLFLGIISTTTGIVGFFVRGLIKEINDVGKRLINTDTRLSIMETQFLNLDKRFTELRESIADLSKDIRELNRTLAQTKPKTSKV
jgi:uncharacterized coiled-coil DUF342 family protein